MRLRWQQFVLSLVLAPFFFCMARMIYLDGDYASRLPRIADSTTGRVRPMTIHGGTHVFASDLEFGNFNRAEFQLQAAGLITMIGGACYVAWRRKQAPE
jgi:hypothetical protein